MKFLTALSLVASASALLISTPSYAGEIRLPKVLADHAVLQRDAPIHLWGWNTPNTAISATFHNQNVSTQSNQDGEWSLYLMPEAKGGPYNLVLDGGPVDGKKELTDILLGDVWIAGGQSNMEFRMATPVKDGPREIAAANYPRIRLLHVPTKSSEFPLPDVDATWTECTPATVGNFSAVAYFFGREISAKEDVPIGLIEAAWGGTPADSWVSLETLGSNADLHNTFFNRATFARDLAKLPARIAREKAEDAAAKAAGKPVPSHPWHAPQESWIPAGPYNGMIAPLTPLSIKGFLWYQGESDQATDRAPHYLALFTALIQDWRAHFDQGDLPFLYVQISSYKGNNPGWDTIRDAQRRSLFLRNTGMVVSTDVGNPQNIHPTDKQTVGARLALAARAIAYGESIAYSGPLFRRATTEQSAMRVWFDFADGLTTNGQPLQGFEVAGEDRHYVPATATIDGNTVKVSAPAVPNPRYVRYDWTAITPPALYNGLALPASTFTSENGILLQ